jgi:nonribosomal peptide synthetase DhbF
MTHGGVVAALNAAGDRFGFGDDDVWSWSHPPASAPSVWEMWGALARGGTLVVVPAVAARSLEEFLRLLARERVTVLCRTPAAFHPLVREDARLSPGLSLHTVLLLEEEVDAGPLDAWFVRHPADAVRLVRMYGVADTAFPVLYTSPDRTGAAEPVGLSAYVLDHASRPLPAGLVGELHVAGPPLAQGHPYRPKPAARTSVTFPRRGEQELLRTGLLARWTGEGRVEYAGRVDDQVRPRGFRVDLGAVRAELARHPKVAAAAVVVREEKQGEERPVAYAVPVDATVTSDELDAWLRERLAAHLVPAVVLLDEWPRTADGRLDRQALPVSAASARAPRLPVSTGLENELCSVMAEVLDVPKVGVDDNFFALGGHSLLAVRFLDRVKDLLDTGRVKLTIRHLYLSPTVAQLTRHLSTQVRSNPLEPVLTMREGTGEPLFCLPAISGLSWAFSAILPHIDGSRPVIGLQSEQLRDPGAEPRDFDELVTAHVARIREVRPNGPYHLMGWSFGGVLAHAVAVRLEALGERVATLALLDARPLTPQRPTTVDRHWALSVLLGREAKEFPEPATDDEVVALLRTHVPVLALLDPDQVAAIVATTMANRKVFLTHHVERRFSADVLFFNAERTSPRSGKEAWGPYVRGEIRQHDVDCGHMEMTRREPLGAIGRIIDEHLRTPSA